ncbi:MAG: CD1247 N-terminal domain-containing protein [Clostridia bacterium]
MSYLTEKAAYLKGLFEGTDLDLSTKEGKLLKAVIELMGDMADEIDDAFDTIDELQEEVDEIDEALADVEEEVFGECDCDDCYDDDDDDDDWDFDDDDELAIECPHCGDTIYLDPSLLENCEDTITCPNCKEEIEIEITDDCDCGCHDDEE